MPAKIQSQSFPSHTEGVPLQPVDLVKEIVRRIREQIFAGHFGSDGEIPTEAELSEMYGVSRTVIREAMRTLRTQGLVEVARGRRPRVKPADPQVAVESLQALMLRTDVDLHHLGEVRRPLEVEIAGLAAERATTEQIDAMRQAIDSQANARSVQKQTDADTRFHELLAESTRNPLLKVLLSTVAPLLNKSRRRTISRVGTERAVAGHNAILAAIKRRDKTKARAAMREHLRMAEEDLEAR
jgi:DNA-binding FadR family transcriptional regulator